MSLDQSLSELQSAFDAVAHEIQHAYPKVWAKASELYTDKDGVVDTDASVNFLIKENYAGWGGKRLIDVAEDQGETAVEDYIEAVMAGVYMQGNMKAKDKDIQTPEDREKALKKLVFVTSRCVKH